MKSSSFPAQPRQFCRSRRFLALAGVSLLAIGLALFVVFMSRAGNSNRFDMLREGMTIDKVVGVLQPTWMGRTPLLAPIYSRFGIEIPESSQIAYCWYSETPLFPGFTATVTFEKGHLTRKEMHAPVIRDILEYWWHQVWERAKP